MGNAKARRAPEGPAESVYVADCTSCGVIGHGLLESEHGPSTVHPQILAHFESEHDQLGMIVEGMHYKIRPQPLLCDACQNVVELPYWTHQASQPINTDEVVDSDGIWLLCDPCHDYLLNRRMIPWVRYIMKIVVTRQRHLAAPHNRDLYYGTRAHMAGVTRELVQYLDDGRRNTLDETT